MHALRVGGLLLTILAIGTAPAAAAPPWASLVPFKHVEADPAKSYPLSQEHGPWLIYAASFAGPNAEQQAHDLVVELRRDLRVSAYVFRQTYDFSEPVPGKGYDKYGKPKMMKQHRGVKYDAFAVLVGDFPSVDDPQAQKALDKIRHADPQCLNPERGTTQRFAGLRHWQRVANPQKRQRGPMANAFVTRNPALSEETFGAGGLDPTVAEMNREAEFSLLRCKGRYTVRVATFRGEETMKIAEISTHKSRRVSGQLEEAAIKANRLAKALREQGVEAYEFHDRYESIVTVGSFDSMGTPLPDGQVEINREIFLVMEQYRPQQKRLPNAQEVGLSPRMLAGIPFDVQPLPIEVPRESIGAQYARTKSWLR